MRRTLPEPLQKRFWQSNRLYLYAVLAVYDDDDKFTPTKHLTPPPRHSSSRLSIMIQSLIIDNQHQHYTLDTYIIYQKKKVDTAL